MGYATEATTALLAIATATFEGELIAMIDPANSPSQNVARKVGFTFWKQAFVDDYWVAIHRLRLP